MKATELEQQGFVILALTTKHQLNAERLIKLRELGVEFRTHATKSFNTEYYVKTKGAADILHKIATNPIK